MNVHDLDIGDTYHLRRLASMRHVVIVPVQGIQLWLGDCMPIAVTVGIHHHLNAHLETRETLSDGGARIEICSDKACDTIRPIL